MVTLSRTLIQNISLGPAHGQEHLLCHQKQVHLQLPLDHSHQPIGASQGCVRKRFVSSFSMAHAGLMIGTQAMLICVQSASCHLMSSWNLIMEQIGAQTTKRNTFLFLHLHLFYPLFGWKYFWR